MSVKRVLLVNGFLENVYQKALKEQLHSSQNLGGWLFDVPPCHAIRGMIVIPDVQPRPRDVTELGERAITL